MYPDKFHLTKEQNRCFAKKNLVRLVFTNSRFEGVNTTLPQTIIDGMSAAGVSIDDSNVIVQLKRGWQYVIREDKALSLKIEQNINLLVARYDSLNPGSFRTDSVTVELGNNKGEWKPQELDYQSEMDFFNNLMQKDTSITDKAMTLMYHNIFCAMLYVLKNGCTWRDLPADYPKWSTVYYYWMSWSKAPTPDKPALLTQVLKKLSLIDD